jgi:hypothetical protein
MNALRAKPSQKLAVDCLKLDHLDITCPASASYAFGENVHSTALEKAASFSRASEV